MPAPKARNPRKVRPALVRERQAALVEAAESAITDLFSNTDVTREQTRDAMNDLIDSIRLKLKTLEG